MMAAASRKSRTPRLERQLRRVSGTRELKQTFLIVCEGINGYSSVTDPPPPF